MKKLFLGLLLLPAILISSCNESKRESSWSTFVWYIASMESATVDQRTPTTHTYTYAQVELNNVLSQLPMLVSEKIVGDTLSEISYSYTPTTITCVRTATDGTQYSDLFNLNAITMASEIVLPNGTVEPYITYDANGMRSKMADVEIFNEPHNAGPVYKEVRKGGEVIARYNYGLHRNYIGLQQHTIFGPSYYWATDRFGLQSAYLLESAVTTEDGVEVQYRFDYDLDSNGFVTKERISRDNAPFLVNTYVIEGAIVSSETNTEK